MLVASLSPRGQPIARDPSRHPPRRVPSLAQAPGGETKCPKVTGAREPMALNN